MFCALKSLTLDVPRGQVTALVGHNGAGKTTLFNAICGLVTPDTGSFSFEGNEHLFDIGMHESEGDHR